MVQVMDKDLALGKLKEISNQIMRLALVMAAARSLSEWSDAQDAAASLMEMAGDVLDQTDLEDQGFVDGHKKVQPIEELLARGERLEAALHRFCGPGMVAHDGCECSDCRMIRENRWEDTE